MVLLNSNCIVLIILYFVYANGHILGNSTRIKRQSNCGDQYQCGSGECISEDSLCDGKTDCKDGSDETSSCASIQCAGYLFRCAYGACINPDFECDGKTDCKDNSDETSKKCKKNPAGPRTCKTDQYQCTSGQCIDDIELCDGIVNCIDGSDETVEACSRITCQPYTYRCAYGGCINPEGRCNGLKDCADNSDEEGCGTTNKPFTPKPTRRPVQPVTRPTMSTGVTNPVVKENPNNCILPQHIEHGKWSIFAAGNFQPGDEVTENTFILHKCNTDYDLYPPISSGYARCSKGNWDNTPKCIRLCPAINLSNETTIFSCELNGEKISCDTPYEGTKVNLKCAPLYQDESLARRPNRYCIDGSWDFPWPHCDPECGHKSVEPQKLIINGTDVVKGDYPWQIGLYRSSNKEHICGGSLLSEKITVTAAHCIETPSEKDYLVAAGKYYRTYDDKRDENAQYSGVAKIIVHKEYNDGEPYLAWDIALLVHSKPFKLTKYAWPVCLDTNPSFDFATLTGKIGVITGWGLTEANSKPSETLKMLEVEYKDRNSCKLPNDFKLYYIPYAPDKMCAGRLGEGKSACRGDSGGGLVFPDEKGIYYIRGIVSLAPRLRAGGCDSSQLSLFTSVRSHIDFILEIQSFYSHK